MFYPLPFVGHHIFLVDTVGGDSAKVADEALALHHDCPYSGFRRCSGR